MSDRNLTTTHMESKKGGRPDKVDKDGASSWQQPYDAAYDAGYEKTVQIVACGCCHTKRDAGY